VEESAKYIVFETEMLTNPADGIVTITTYYSDGSKEFRSVPKHVPVRFMVPILELF